MSVQSSELKHTEPRLNYVTCASPAGAHRMAYWEWGKSDNPNVLLCVHGLTRSGRDFDPLARLMSDTYRVVCPDVVGRGRSDWLINPEFYAITQYIADMFTLIARLSPAKLDWVGTSMGGLIGLGVAAALNLNSALCPHRCNHGLGSTQRLRLGKMVLNDIGPVIDANGLSRIADYVGQPKSFQSFDQAVDYIKAESAEFGKHTHEQWQDLTRNVFVQDNGQWVKHYDLRIALPMAEETPEAIESSQSVLWPAYESLSEPILIVRGEHSDLLSEHTVQLMLQRNSNAKHINVSDAGHAPTLRVPEQLNPIRQFLLD